MFVAPFVVPLAQFPITAVECTQQTSFHPVGCRCTTVGRGRNLITLTDCVFESLCTLILFIYCRMGELRLLKCLQSNSRSEKYLLQT